MAPKEKYEPFVPLTKTSRIGKEFGIENHSGTLNCFINVSLQSLWQCPRVRQELLFFCDVREGGPPAIKPFINALQDFYTELAGKQGPGYIPVISSSKVRRELFKLNYLKNEFVLN